MEVAVIAGEGAVVVGREEEGEAEIEVQRWMPYESRRSCLASRTRWGNPKMTGAMHAERAISLGGRKHRRYARKDETRLRLRKGYIQRHAWRITRRGIGYEVDKPHRALVHTTAAYQVLLPRAIVASEELRTV